MAGTSEGLVLPGSLHSTRSQTWGLPQGVVVWLWGRQEQSLPWPRACCGAQMGLRGPQGISEVGPGDFGGVARHLGQGGLAQRAAQMAGWGKPLQLIARGPQSLLCCDSSFLCIASGKKWIQRLSDFTCEQRSLYSETCKKF